MFARIPALFLLLFVAVFHVLPQYPVVGFVMLKSGSAMEIGRRAPANVTEENKAGLGWNNPRQTLMSQFLVTDKVGWYYTWSSWPNGQGNDLDFVPLLWGRQAISDWRNAVRGRLRAMFESKAITCVLGFNEPQERGQANMDVEEAKEIWMAELVPLKTQYGVRLGSPATSSAPSGKTWTREFLDLCGTDCSVDFIALHYYGTNATHFINYITDFYETFKMPIWVTEWACHDFGPRNDQCTQDEVREYMNVTQSFMETAPWLERYAWFGALVNNPIHPTNDLLSDSGSITALGQQYIQMTPEQIEQAADGNSPPYWIDGSNHRMDTRAIGRSSGLLVPILLTALPFVLSYLT